MTTTSASLPDQFAEAGGTLLDPEDSGYPPTMCDRTGRPTLYVMGDPQALSQPGLGLCGARTATPAGIDLAHRLGALAAKLEVPLVSGYAVGVDSAGHLAAIESGGRTTAVLAEGIAKFRLRPEFLELIDPLDQMIAVSPFPPQARWTVINAMQRNRTICSLSRLLVAIEPGEKGGTLNAAQEALRQGVPLVVAATGDGQIPAHIARLVRRDATLARSEAELVAAVMRSFADGSQSQPIGQAALFD